MLLSYCPLTSVLRRMLTTQPLRCSPFRSPISMRSLPHEVPCRLDVELAGPPFACCFSALKIVLNIGMSDILSTLAICLFPAAFAWSAYGQNADTIPAGIEKLHNDDITATIARDVDALTAYGMTTLFCCNREPLRSLVRRPSTTS